MSGAQVDAVAREAAGWLRATLPQARARRAHLRSDSRQVGAGDVFVAWPGASSDGRRHLAQAIAAGAAAALVEAEGFDDAAAPAVPVLRVAGLRECAGRIASEWLGEPSAALEVVAVTGTNGKTSCTQWIAAGCNARARRAVAGVIGTLGASVPVGPEGARPDAVAPAAQDGVDTGGLTTPDALALQHLFRAFVDSGVEIAAIEASSIGLEQGRLEGTRIAVAVMTNLTRDHLDFHGSFDAYARAKARLFRWPGLKAAVFNLDDPAAVEMSGSLADGVARIGFSIVANDRHDLHDRHDHGPTVRVLGTPPDAQGRVRLSIGAQSAALRLAPIGRFNLSNALAVAGVWHALGWTFDEIVDGLGSLRPVPGRLQRVGPGDGAQACAVDLPLVVVDYAHTPDALANVLATMREVAQQRQGRLWCVFGAGGNRDRGKRAPMASAAEAGADELVLTSDNPRDEDPIGILDDLCKGLSRPARLVEPDRREAIARAVALAAVPDVIVIAGKGHEDYQEVRGVRTPFSDALLARAALGARRAEGGRRAH